LSFSLISTISSPIYRYFFLNFFFFFVLFLHF
jgi:hypothetical protein